MQRGHDTEPLFSTEVPAELPLLWLVCGMDKASGPDCVVPRWVAALIAALRTVVNGGLMPQARHGDRCVLAVAVAGSKFDGTGLENEQIGHIHVALTGFGEGAWCVAADWGRGESGFTGCRVDGCGTAGLAVALRVLSLLFFCGLGYIVIFADDFKKPACNACTSVVIPSHHTDGSRAPT